MAEKSASLVIELKDKLSSGIQGLKGKLSEFRSGLLAAGTAVAGVTAFLVSAFKAYQENETAVNKLNVALKNQGITTAGVSEDLQKFAAQMQRTTTFSDETVLRAQALLTTFGLVGDKLKQTTSAAADLASSLGIDLQQAAMLLGKAAAGETGTLARYGIKISETIPPAQKLDEVLRQLQQRFGGAAQAELNTTAGRIENLKNRYDELTETIGRHLLPVFEYWANVLEKVMKRIESFTGAMDENLKGRELTIKALEKEKLAMENNLATLERFGTAGAQTQIDSTRAKIDAIDKAIAREKESLAETQQIEQEKINAIKGTNLALAAEDAKRAEARAKDIEDARSKSQSMVEGYMSEQQQLTALREFYGATEAQMLNQKLNAQQVAELTAHMKRLNALGQFAEAKKLKLAALDAAEREQATKLEEFKVEKEKQRIENMAATLSKISTLSTAHNKGLAAIGKAAAIAIATQDTYVAANKALASAPPPWNFALAAAVTAAGVFNVAQIAGVNLAKGGIVMPTNGGTIARIGEAGSREAVIPLDDPGTKEELGNVFGGTTVIINAGTVIADRLSIQEFAGKIDEELFRLRKNRNSVAFD